ncbi:2-succinyl-6-hydroxy-2,4-cyclohexadiene-1-carboxylate synthase [Bacillus canaveralius]|uniref:Putative 2-succinyl-6-hydroxy-2,4-cyclohexadiene-1-carboxylate synthase n=1 Tax=Bacillus canaveralius TaxID=1403243 RepID=A0A2N5GPJ5_9BACI|nr:2-succinyl-6-hydroxy-2,4-cyclohexadiene-1-carboxylate synthase [Bacillus canaveralius]PLR84451.1 2-succinyl-6-hydroxy-2,4-cyclohexadiene-1-carboxylate synthase [Bacillus canaveralius]PLS00547.1 2-succinyl-6-hydroxy-2,4-cyclohexadiene-1-carboxylate synthase [Bacillus canaveralius]RSK57832.1 2-succinyl-6-hydroxy-2,4-cyclohexadiene-1-carboxylate synthase [Bacillus canaveralius]
MKYVLNGINFHVRRCGDGFPLILLHGFTGDSSGWEPFCKLWGGHSELIMPDIIGHGKTDCPNSPDRYHIESAAEDLCELLDQMEIGQADVLGYSMGGRLALTFAKKYPGRVRKLILESASPGLKTAEERSSRRSDDEQLAQFILEKGVAQFVSYWEEIPLFSSQKSLSEQKKELIRQQRLNNSAIGLANSLIGMGTGAQPSWWNDLRNLQHHTLLITGIWDDKFCTIAALMAEQLPQPQWITVNKAGHAVHVEQPEKFGTIVSRFLIHT